MRTYGTIKRSNDGWIIDKMEPHVVIRLKALFPRIRKTDRPPLLLTGGPELDADLEWFMARYPLEMIEADRQRMREQRELFESRMAELEVILAKGWKPSSQVAFRKGERPYDYQIQAAEVARRTGRLLIMDEMGLGKTVTGLASIVDPEFLPAMIVMQTHLQAQWAAKIEEFTTLTHHTISKTKPYELPPVDVYLCPYSKLAGWCDYAEQVGFRSIIFDEIQELRKGQDSLKGRAAKRFRNRARLTVGLSGTPIFNYGLEMFDIMEFVEPGCLGDRFEFIREWCAPGPGGNWIVEDPDALGTMLRERHLTIRRVQGDVGDERQPVNTVTMPIEMDDGELADKQELARQLAQTVLSGEFTEKGQAAREFDMMMRHATGVGKARFVAAYVRMLVEQGGPVVLVGWHRDVYRIWLDELADLNPVLYTGTESPAKKHKAQQAFVNGESDVLILSLRSGAGLDGLQHRCHRIVFGELDWSPQVHAQCVARLDRPGQTQQVDAIYLYADEGSDPTVMGVLGVKASQSHGIVDPGQKPKAKTVDLSRIQTLAQEYLAAKPKEKPAPRPRPAPRGSLLAMMEAS